jgi:predicted nucleic acid-binding protein
VYIETSIPSFYWEVRKEPEMVARRHWTRAWWHERAGFCEAVTSELVLDELSQGKYRSKTKCLQLVAELPLLAVEPAIAEIAEVYIRREVMPRDPAGDALHLALASYHRCDFLLTWNCAHMANANKFDHIRRTNVMLGLFVPALVTPLELLGADSDEA